MTTTARANTPFMVTPTAHRNISIAQRISDSGTAIGQPFEVCRACFSPVTGGGVSTAGVCSGGCGRLVVVDDETLVEELRNERINTDSIRDGSGRKKPMHPRASSHRATRVSRTSGVSPVVGVNYRDVPDATDL